ncbi:MAG: DUF5717 family protein [Hungatella sp.]
MRERINRLAKGIIDIEVPLLVLQPSSLNEAVQAGEKIKKEIYISSENGLNIKGLIYSSNKRVSVSNSAFGGLRNHIGFEINSRYLEPGDVIEGSFYLVTNGGEKEIPYSYRVEAGNSGKLLGQLKRPEDFANIAQEDFDRALRLFEYQDFTEVPFMQDMHIRAIYDGLKGQGNRYAQLEEFLVALKVKMPVEMIVSEEEIFYDNPREVLKDTIEIQKNGWGYLPIEVKTDGAFIQLTKKKLVGSDFTDNACSLSYQISPGRLHGGKNYGKIFLCTAVRTACIPIVVFCQQEDMTQEQNPVRYARYLSLRLTYECRPHGSKAELDQMLEEVEQLRIVGGCDVELKLITAELYTLVGSASRAEALLNECRPEITKIRRERVDLYCLWQYISLLVKPEEAQRESLIRLLDKYLEEDKKQHLLFFLLLKLNPQLQDNPGELLMQLEHRFLEGCHSPFLYLEAVKWWNQKPELLYHMNTFEIQALHFASKRELVTEPLAQRTAKLLSTAKNYNRLACMLLMQLYGQYPKRELLEAICSMLIRGECHRKEDFVWYEKALKEQISLTRLYEYYLYAFPEDFNQLIPREVLLYFSYDHELNASSKSVLYRNILTYMNPDTALYQEYEKVIGKFATEQIFESKIDSSLAVIYDHMIYADMIDPPVAGVLAGLLRSYRIVCNQKSMRYVVICYEELMEEGIYPLQDGIAYAPLFSKKSIILFQDAYGNRYTDVGCVKTSVLDKPDLEERCFEVYPNHPMMLLKACEESSRKEVLEEDDASILEKALSELKLHPLYKKQLSARLIEYYRNLVKEPEDSAIRPNSTYLLSVDKKNLSRIQRTGICEALISQDYYQEAFDMIREYGIEGIPIEELSKLCVKMILQQLFDQDEWLLSLAYQVFEAGMSDGVILDYLCEYFNGTTLQMYRILKLGIAEHVETYDLEERLLAQMLFSDQTAQMDQVFSYYMDKGKTGDNIVKAYFTMKSTEYFMQGTPADDQVFAYLEGMINGTIEKDKISTIYLLALSKYYATLSELDAEQTLLCQDIINILLAEGMVFPYYKNLATHITIPATVLDQCVIQYIGQRDSDIDLQIRILPGEEQYHSDDMRRVYQGIFIKQKILFEGEVLDYQIYEQKDGKRLLADEGKITCELWSAKDGESRFGCLNQMSFYLGMKEEENLKKTMKEYLTKTAAVEELFKVL